MTEQPDGRLSAKAESLADKTPRPAVRPTESSPAEIHRYPKSAMNDAQRLDELRAKLRRIEGHKSLSPRQEQAAIEIIREIVAIEGPVDWSKVFDL
jgi:hypothetical protein